jgi:hypothetical protein
MFRMSPVLIITPILLFVAVLLFFVLRGFGRFWLDHSIRLALLEKIEKKPELLEQVRELMDMFSAVPTRRRNRRQDYRVTGIVLAIFGVASCAAGIYMRSGRAAVGIYIGGYICIAIAAILFLLGLAIQWLNRNPVIVLRKE